MKAQSRSISYGHGSCSRIVNLHVHDGSFKFTNQVPQSPPPSSSGEMLGDLCNRVGVRSPPSPMTKKKKVINSTRSREKES